MQNKNLCPCGNQKPYLQCCGVFHRGERRAPTPQALMRSRFSAFALGDVGYLVRTWHASTCPAGLKLDDNLHWTSLEVISHSQQGHIGTVHFRAHYQMDGRVGRLEERSRFVREDGYWLYIDGEVE